MGVFPPYIACLPSHQPVNCPLSLSCQILLAGYFSRFAVPPPLCSTTFFSEFAIDISFLLVTNFLLFPFDRCQVVCGFFFFVNAFLLNYAPPLFFFHNVLEILLVLSPPCPFALSGPLFPTTVFSPFMSSHWLVRLGCVSFIFLGNLLELGRACLFVFRVHGRVSLLRIFAISRNAFCS